MSIAGETVAGSHGIGVKADMLLDQVDLAGADMIHQGKSDHPSGPLRLLFQPVGPLQSQFLPRLRGPLHLPCEHIKHTGILCENTGYAPERAGARD